MYECICIFRTSSEKFDCRTIKISWEIYKKLKTEEFLHMGLFIFDIRTLNFSILQKTTFAAQALDSQVQGKKIPIFVYVRYQSEDT